MAWNLAKMLENQKSRNNFMQPINKPNAQRNRKMPFLFVLAEFGHVQVTLRIQWPTLSSHEVEPLKVERLSPFCTQKNSQFLSKKCEENLKLGSNQQLGARIFLGGWVAPDSSPGYYTNSPYQNKEHPRVLLSFRSYSYHCCRQIRRKSSIMTIIKQMIFMAKQHKLGKQ